MKKFDVYDFLYEGFLNEKDDPYDTLENNPEEMEMDPDPNSQGMVPPTPQTDTQKQGEQGSPEQQSKQMKASETVFADAKGKVIKKIDFNHPSTNSGEIKIYFAEFDLPMVISWSNDKVTVSKPPTGEPIAVT